jgi:transposase
MRKVREVLRLRWERGLSKRQIGLSCSIGRTTVQEYLERAGKAGLTWPLPESLDDETIEQMLFPSGGKSVHANRALPDWSEIHRELKRKGVTLALLWQEYKARHPDGYQYSQFCELYRTWLGHVDPVMRQRHRAGEKLFVDYAGQTITVIGPMVGELREAQLFVAVMGASNYTYAEATWTQTLADWIGSHVRALEFFEGIPEVLVPDNLKTGVSHPCRYEPEINPTYRELADHYGLSVLPARVRKPKDKAKVENGVQQAERWILAPLRHRTFFDLNELNEAVRERLIELNHRPFQKLPGSRFSFFEQLERPVLRPLPKTRYEYAEWKRATVGSDYHVEVDSHYYSVPYRFIRHKLDVRLTRATVECFHKGVRVASHLRGDVKGEFSTVKEHMPLSHQRYLEWTPERIIGSAEKIGADVAELVKAVLRSQQHQQLGLRSCLGVLRLAKEYGEDRLSAASQRALAMQALSYKSVRSILRTGLDRAPLPEATAEPPPIHHENLRGPGYFN